MSAENAILYQDAGVTITVGADDRRHELEFGNDAVVYDGVERLSFPTKGRHRNHVSSILLRVLEERDIPTWFLRPEGSARMAVRPISMFPLDVYCCNAAGGSMASRLGLTHGEVLPMTLVEFCLEGRGRGRAPVPVSRLHSIKTITEGDVKLIQARAMMANRALWDFLYAHGIVMAEIRLRFGRDNDRRLRVACDLSPDTARLWDRADHEKIDRDRYRTEIGTDEQSYHRIAKMLTD